MSASLQRGESDAALARRHAATRPPPIGTSPQRARASGPQARRRTMISSRGDIGGKAGAGAADEEGGGAGEDGAAAGAALCGVAVAGEAGDAGAAAGCFGAGEPSPAALTAARQAGDRLAEFFFRQARDAEPPVGTPAQLAR